MTLAQDPDCTAVGVDDIGVDDFVDTGGASHVLYVQICGHSQNPGTGCYNNHMNKGGYSIQNLMNTDYAGTGSTIRLVTLGSSGFSEAGKTTLDRALEWSKYTQVWVGDLSSHADQYANQIAGYQKIIDWYHARGSPHIICDGRYLSSMWGGRSGYWNDPRTNHGLVRNYFANLRVRGGGLQLSTDHAIAFTRGINNINSGIGIKPFVNFYHQAPYLMEVDIENTVWSYPERGYYTQAELERSAGGQPRLSSYWTTPYVPSTMGFIFDDSSTSDAPFNLQPNGKILYPISWHRGYLNSRPGISSTIAGKVGFLVGISSPSCDDHFEQDDVIQFNVDVLKGGGPGTSFTWSSSIDGQIQAESTTETFSRAANLFSPGEHIIVCRAKDPQGLVAEARVRIRVVFLSGDPICFSAGWNGGQSPQELFPLKRGGSAVDFYSYGTPTPDGANTNLEIPRVGQWFFYENDDDTISLVGLFGSSSSGNSASRARASISITGYDTSDVVLQLRDSQFTPANYIWTAASAEGTFTFEFGTSTAGAILGPFTKKEFCVNIEFDKTFEDNLQSFYVRSHAVQSTAQVSVNPSNIVFYSSSAVGTEDITMCYGQCECPTSEYSELTDQFNNRGINFLLQTGILGEYTDIHSCSWTIKPDSTHAIWGISVYFDSPFALAASDDLVIADSGDSVLATYTSVSGSAPFHSGDNVDELRITFDPNNDGNTEIGFGATFWVLPQLNSVTPDRVPGAESTTVTFHGHNFVDSPNLKCTINSVEYPATFIDSDTITCVAPPRGTTGFVNVEVSNDGQRFTSTILAGAYPQVQLEYFDATCDELQTCGSCIDNGCQFCNIDASNSFCFSGTNDCVDNGGVVEDLCTSCYGSGSCDNFTGGVCNANDTCTCNDDRFDIPSDCSCKKCPTHPNGEYCGGVLASDRLVGECGCDGVCVCGPGFNGPDCSCTDCGGYNGEVCGGVGTCECDGNCTCDEGYRSLTDVVQICECSDTCPTATNEICSGHGTCNCGACVCEPEWNLLEDCSCASSCPDNCNGNGICGCGGECTCSPGFYGETCDQLFICSGDCGNCTSNEQGGCSWCEADQQCVHPSEAAWSLCRPNELQRTCPDQIIQEAPTQNHLGTYLAIAIGLFVALIIAVLVALLIARTKPSSDLLLYGSDPFGGGEGVHESGIHEASTTKGSSKLYTSAN